MGEYLTCPEVAKQLKVRSNTIYTWCKKGYLPHVRIERTVRVVKEDLEKFLKEKRIDGVSR